MLCVRLCRIFILQNYIGGILTDCYLATKMADAYTHILQSLSFHSNKKSMVFIRIKVFDSSIVDSFLKQSNNQIVENNRISRQFSFDSAHHQLQQPAEINMYLPVCPRASIHINIHYILYKGWIYKYIYIYSYIRN